MDEPFLCQWPLYLIALVDGATARGEHPNLLAAPTAEGHHLLIFTDWDLADRAVEHANRTMHPRRFHFLEITGKEQLTELLEREAASGVEHVSIDANLERKTLRHKPIRECIVDIGQWPE